jgi:hypothetical protein
VLRMGGMHMNIGSAWLGGHLHLTMTASTMACRSNSFRAYGSDTSFRLSSISGNGRSGPF